MQESEYVNTGNLIRIRAAMKILMECVFIDEEEDDKNDEIIHTLVGMEWRINKKVKIEDAPQNAVEQNGHIAQQPQA
jgi:hypothetical protein